MRADAETTGKTDITTECTGRYKIWVEVYNVDHTGRRTGGTHFAPISAMEFETKTAARAAIREWKNEQR